MLNKYSEEEWNILNNRYILAFFTNNSIQVLGWDYHALFYTVQVLG